MKQNTLAKYLTGFVHGFITTALYFIAVTTSFPPFWIFAVILTIIAIAVFTSLIVKEWD